MRNIVFSFALLLLGGGGIMIFGICFVNDVYVLCLCSLMC